MFLRIVTAAVLIPLVVALVWFAPPPLFAAVAASVALVALVEFMDLGERVGLRPFPEWTIICAAGIFYAQYFAGFAETRALAGGQAIVRNPPAGALSVEAVLLIFIFGAAVIAMATRRPLHEVLPAISIGSAGLLFVALPFSYILRIS
jgi:CDP-diglyceride synthetase